MSFLVDLFIAGLIGRAFAARERRRHRRRQSEGVVRCLMKIVEGEYPGLYRTSWRVTDASLSEGLIESDLTCVEVVWVDRSLERQPGFRESWSGPTTDTRVVLIGTDSARIEWAVPQAQVDWAVGVVLGTEEVRATDLVSDRPATE